MKRTFLFLTLVLFSATLLAENYGDYVITGQGTFFFKKVKFGINCCLVGIKENGEKVKFKKAEILSFEKGGQQFEKRPVYKGNEPTGEQEFMALVCYRKGMKLYEYEYISKVSQAPSRRYYVFKGDKFICEMDNANKPTLSAFFTGK